MKYRTHTSIVAILTLLINILGVSAQVAPKSSVAGCIVQERQGNNPAHQRHGKQRPGHKCCPAVTGRRPIDVNHASLCSRRHPLPLSFGDSRPPAVQALAAAGALLRAGESHSPQSAIALFLSFSTLLL